MYVIGVTGGIGTGKSTVAKLFGLMGLPVLDADQISHDVTARGGMAVNEVIEIFGTDILDEAGDIDRSKLGDLVFSDKNRLDRLSAIVHRWVIATIQEEVKKLEKKKVKACVLDVPIPVKEGFLDLANHVVVVWAGDSVRIQRLAKRGMSEAEARRRMAMQMTEEEYSSLAHEVIRNDGSLDELLTGVQAIAERELRSRGIRVNEITDEGLNELRGIRVNEITDEELNELH